MAPGRTHVFVNLSLSSKCPLDVALTEILLDYVAIAFQQFISERRQEAASALPLYR